MLEPAREFIVKIVEMSLWSSDFLIAHFLLLILTPPTLIPFVDKLHSTMLCESFSLHETLPKLTPGSLAPTIETNTRPAVLYKPKAAAQIDCKTFLFSVEHTTNSFETGFQVCASLFDDGRSPRLFACFA